MKHHFTTRFLAPIGALEGCARAKEPMNKGRRFALAGLGLFLSAATLLCPTASYAADFPSKPLRLVVPFPPGGLGDIVGRLIAPPLASALGQQVIIENKSGAGGVVGTEAGIKAPADGYTLTLIASAYTIYPSLYKLGFDPIGDITPIIRVAEDPLLVVESPSTRLKTIKELIAHAKANPGKLNFASAGQGTPPHLAAELFASDAGIKMNHIPYKGGGPALVDTMAGQTDLFFSPLSIALPHVRTGKLSAIAVTSARRHPNLPDIPTVAESGLPNYEVAIWIGMIGPKGLSRSIVDRLNGDVAKVLSSRETRERLLANGSSPIGGTPEQFAEIIKREIEIWRNVVREAGVKAE